MEKDCPLCELQKLTKWYFDEDDFVVIECLKCKIPMYVWKDHSFPTGKEIEMLIEHAHNNFPDRDFDFKRRTIPEHYHFHMR